MPVAEHPRSVEPASLLDRRYRISVGQYHRMADAGILGPEPRLELLEGLLVVKMTKNPPHIIATELIQNALPRLLPDGWYLSMQNPIAIPEDDSEPEPDAQVVRGRPRDYREGTHGPGDTGLVIEVADTSYAFDRGEKLVGYARASIPAYWILDLNRRLLEAFTDPTGPADPAYYRGCRTFGPDDEVPIVLDGREVARIAVRDLLS